MPRYCIVRKSGFLYAGQSPNGKVRWTRKISECWECSSFKAGLLEMKTIDDPLECRVASITKADTCKPTYQGFWLGETATINILKAGKQEPFNPVIRKKNH